MARKILALAFALTASVPSAALSANAEGIFSVRGLGGITCGDMVSALMSEEDTRVSERFVAWIAGYLSHANRTHPTAHDVMPIQTLDGIATVVARLCDNNREATVEAVVHSVSENLSPLALAQPEPPLEARNGDAMVLIRPSVLEAVQEGLVARELLPGGAADGIFGPQTSQALTALQAGLGIEQTGLPDAWTVFLIVTTE